MNDDVHVRVRSDLDILTARQAARSLGAEVGATSCEQTLLASAISEITRNMITYARGGEITMTRRQEGGRAEVLITARDEGPGIANLELAMQDGYSTSRSLGVGLPGTKRLMDEFEIETGPGKGTTVRMTWSRSS